MKDRVKNGRLGRGGGDGSDIGYSQIPSPFSESRRSFARGYNAQPASSYNTPNFSKSRDDRRAHGAASGRDARRFRNDKRPMQAEDTKTRMKRPNHDQKLDGGEIGPGSKRKPIKSRSIRRPGSDLRVGIRSQSAYIRNDMTPEPRDFLNRRDRGRATAPPYASNPGQKTGENMGRNTQHKVHNGQTAPFSRTRQQNENFSVSHTSDSWARNQHQRAIGPDRSGPNTTQMLDAGIVPNSAVPQSTKGRWQRRSQEAGSSELTPRRNFSMPLSIPYTTPASQFLYGTSVITAALKTRRRKMYKLYIYEGTNREKTDQDSAMRTLARRAGVELAGVPEGQIRMMDKMSGGRPHNGYILEASPLPKLPSTGLETVSLGQKEFGVTLDHQSREDEQINGTKGSIKWNDEGWRYPFILMLDEIQDPGNLGAIIRSAFFLGVDALAVSIRNSAQFTTLTLKASAGASESLPLLSISHPAAFIDASTKSGWKFFAAVTPPIAASTPRETKDAPEYLKWNELNGPLARGPCVLMLGSEGEGLRWNLIKKAHRQVGIEGKKQGFEGVDSLNVSVAAALLCEKFLLKPTVEDSSKQKMF
ncbi:MAG: hypothetical protein M1829_004475 [Trizodia sp. TS-e1964]|nr:MAG: hypothetical protein M1829_004475 [Trizodia sp. TS-e1964]